MDNKTKVGVALVKRLCIICTNEEDAEIVMNTILTESEAKAVEEMHGKVVGFTEKPCKECQEMMDKAFLFIGIDEAKTDFENLPEGFFRSGNIVGVKKEIPLVQEFVKEHSPLAYEKGYLFIDTSMMTDFGLLQPID